MPFGDSEFPTLFQQEYDYSLDLWSFGCMFASMVCISVLIDDSAKGGLTQFWELFTMIPCEPKYLKR